MDTYVVVSLAIAVLATVFTAYQSFLWRRDTLDRRKMEQVQFVREFEADLAELTPRLHDALGGPDDGIDENVRAVVVPLLVLYGQVFLAHRDDLFRKESWEGLRAELRYWMSTPPARQAWTVLRQYVDYWPDGFIEFVDDELTRTTGMAHTTEDRARGTAE